MFIGGIFSIYQIHESGKLELIYRLTENNLDKSDSKEFDALMHLIRNTINSLKSVVDFIRTIF